jgi:hypothetical protein
MNYTKRCTKCQGEFPATLEFFYKESRKKTGLMTKCKTCMSEYHKSYYKSNHEIIKKRNKTWRENNPDYYKDYERPKSYHDNKNEWYRKKYNKDSSFQVSVTIKRGIWGCLNGKQKTFSSIEYIGCSIDDLKLHLEEQFTDGMNWENYGDWHIDHIKPLCSFDFSKEEELFYAWNYTNLQPLWAKDNLAKGGSFHE